MKINQIFQGHVLNILKTLPSESIDCCITSPPYWALRNYDTKPQVWDGDEECDHKWIGQIKKWHGDRGKGKCKEVFDDSFQVEGTKSDFCAKCGAWRGNFGLEPDFNLYIKHLCDIFDEIKRVLRKTGSCWVVIGDTYGGSGGAAGHTETTKNLGYTTSKMGATKGIAQNLMPKCLLQIPERFAIEMCNRGWILRNKIIWHKPNCMPSSAADRFTIDFEYVYFFTKSKKYYFEQQFEPHLTQESRPDGCVREREYGYNSKYNKLHYKKYSIRQKRDGKTNPDYRSPQGRNKRCVWTITTKPYKGAHFAVFPEGLIETPVKAGCPEFVCKKCGKPREKVYKTKNNNPKYTQIDGKETQFISKGQHRLTDKGTTPHFNPPTLKHIGYTDCGCNFGFKPGVVLDPFLGSGTTAVVAKKLNRNWLGIELNPSYIKLAEKRIANVERTML